MNRKTALRACPVCGKRRAEILAAMRYAVPEGFPLPAESDIVACLGCGMVYADTSGTQADYDRYYADFANYENPNGQGSGMEGADARRLEQSVDWLAPRIGAKNARIIDIGCVQGGLLMALARRGFSSLSGIDPSPRCVDLLRAAGFSGHQGSFGHIPAECGKYDFIIASHVLEHVVDVREAFSALRQLLAPGGKIYIKTPDAGRYYNRKGTLPFQEINQEHINHFDLFHLDMLCAAHGLHVTDVVRKSIGERQEQNYAVGVLLAEKEQEACIAPPSSEATHLKQLFAAYILESRRRLDSFSEKIRGRAVAFWGAGRGRNGCWQTLSSGGKRRSSPLSTAIRASRASVSRAASFSLPKRVCVNSPMTP
ncbi:MAG: class I SAM-dependent methyltransferase [Zoogloeaceae bacterium]|jgi:2-polyprenyl-3-methyl-5-hydroxy-6-metoxy-1,4-benzoquinol methylase|nr:class I SAM-dependent methyltransferase [Zoogloeaceae bacterium]